jgi:dCTP deaminase-like
VEVIDVEQSLKVRKKESLWAKNAVSHRQIYLALRLNDIWHVTVDEVGRLCKTEFDTKEKWLVSGRMYLARSMEEISIPWDIFGMMSTKSETSRRGLDCLGSSVFISPGFGQTQPAPLILELRPQIDTPCPARGDVLAHAMFFRMGFQTAKFAGDHHLRFPLED